MKLMTKRQFNKYHAARAVTTVPAYPFQPNAIFCSMIHIGSFFVRYWPGYLSTAVQKKGLLMIGYANQRYSTFIAVEAVTRFSGNSENYFFTISFVIHLNCPAVNRP
jgi:hypothetical protein